MRSRTGSRTWLRVLLGTAYLAAGASVAIIFSAEPGQDITWGLRLFTLSLIPALVFTVLLITRLRFEYLRLSLPWYGLPYQLWLIGAPPRSEGIQAIIAYVWMLLGTLVFLIATLATLATRP
jgi:hypothetical protein